MRVGETVVKTLNMKYRIVSTSIQRLCGGSVWPSWNLHVDAGKLCNSFRCLKPNHCRPPAPKQAYLHQVEQFKQDPSPTKCLHSVFNVVTGDEIHTYSDYHHLQVSPPAHTWALWLICWLLTEMRKSAQRPLCLQGYQCKSGSFSYICII